MNKLVRPNHCAHYLIGVLTVLIVHDILIHLFLISHGIYLGNVPRN
jgi:hypothetical protein